MNNLVTIKFYCGGVYDHAATIDANEVSPVDWADGHIFDMDWRNEWTYTIHW